MAARFPIEYPSPPDAPPLVPPTNPKGLLDEWRIAVQIGRLVSRLPRLADAPRGDGAPALLVPGWKAPEWTMSPLRTYLRLLGHDARHWGLGTNTGDPEPDTEALLPRVEALAEATGRRVALIGWSLGGVIAREVARELPDAVSAVVTYGTPLVGGPSYTLAARAWGRDECARIAAMAEESDRTNPIQVPVTSIFTRRDAVVAWGACIDRTTPGAAHVEVASTHVSLGVDPDVLRSVAERLAA
jgi:pimeloyl-ACP methyl ester carboxylesterase